MTSSGHNGQGEEGGIKYGVSAMQGWRSEMQDRHTVSLSLPAPLNDWVFAGVFDGHSGTQVVSYVATNLLQTIVNCINAIPSEAGPGSGSGRKTSRNRHRQIRDAIIQAFLGLDETIWRNEAITEDSGTTASCVLISPTHYYFANCGDSRGILVKGGNLRFATKDHKPWMKEEKKRIEAAGGAVFGNRLVKTVDK